MKPQHYLIIGLLQAASLLAFSQKPRLRFEHLGPDNGLSQNNVLSILQDVQGFMWFGTNDGLNKYDGYNFTVYKAQPNSPKSINGHFIMDMANSRDGNIWIATLGGGISLYDRRKDCFNNFLSSLNDPNSISVDDVNTILEDNEGMVWIGTTAGLDVYDPAKKLFTHYKHSKTDVNTPSDNYIRDIIHDSDQNIWIATANGLNLFDKKTRRFTRFLHVPGNSLSIGTNDISALFEDSKKRIWIGTTRDGLEMLDKGKGVFTHYTYDPNAEHSAPDKTIRSIQEDQYNRLWIGTENAGLIIFDPKTLRFYNYLTDEVDRSSLGSNSINDLYRDAKGNMWVGTFNAGIDFMNNDAGKFPHFRHVYSENSLANNHVLCFYEDSKKKVWIGTDGGGVDVYDPATGKFTNYSHKKNDNNSLCGNNVLCVMEDSKGNMWMGTWGEGVSMFDPRKNKWLHLKHDPLNPNSLSSNNAWTILEDRDKKIWIGTYGNGLNMYDPATGTFTHFIHREQVDTGLLDNWISALYEDQEGNIWVSTAGSGINIFNKKTQQFSYITQGNTKSSLNGVNVGCITEDSRNNLWITSTTGLHVLDRKLNKVIIFTREHGLPSNVVYGVLEDSRGNMWISTAQGISRYTPSTRKFKNFTVADGLQSNEFKEKAFLKASDGSMYFGGNNGFNRFVPEDVRSISFDPPLVVTNFQVFNKDVPIATGYKDPSPLKQSITETRAITLPYSSSVFSFEFSSLNYAPAERKQYAYMLQGFDETWNEVGTQRTATYTNLDPGRYIFKVKGLNNEGEWSDRITFIELTITPPFWMTWWFRMLGILLLVASIVLVYKLRLNSINSQKRELEIQVKRQTLQLERKNKELEQFAYVASHDLQEPLRTTSSFIELLQKQYQGKLDEKADKYFMFIDQSSKRMRTLISDLLDYSRIGRKGEIQRVDCNKVLQEVIADLGMAIKDSNANIKVGPLPVINGYSTELKLLFQNLIVNAMKFRKKDTSAEISVSAEKKDGHWKFAVRDNGIGIEEEHKERIFIIFQRLHTRNEYTGSGIGLAHCKKIVELHKGNIWVESKVGEGSVFYFTVGE